MSSPAPAAPPPTTLPRLRLVAYYAVVVGAIALAWKTFPGVVPRLATLADASRLRLASVLAATPPVGHATAAWTVALSMISAALLSLPVAWVYRFTRAKKGYQQAVMQTLVLLPTVVAGVVVMVKDSLPLAFGLAGIVAAVRFRTTLDDSKDAIHVFLATGIGLATAVDLPVAVVLSLVFNAVTLAFWYTDFGRGPADLQGAVAARRFRGAVAHPTRTDTFVARVDDELLGDLSPRQLELLAERAKRRARALDPDSTSDRADAGATRQERRLLVRTHDAEQARHALEPVLDAFVKRWRPGATVHDADGSEVLEFHVQLRKDADPAEVLSQLRSASRSHVVGAEFG